MTDVTMKMPATTASTNDIGPVTKLVNERMLIPIATENLIALSVNPMFAFMIVLFICKSRATGEILR